MVAVSIVTADSFLDEVIETSMALDSELMQDEIANPTIFKPCVGCYGPSPTPVPYTKAEVAFSMSASTVKLGKSITLSGYQTGGATLGSGTKWQFTAQNGNQIQTLIGQTVTLKPTKKGTYYWITLTARDEASHVSGSYTIKSPLTVT